MKFLVTHWGKILSRKINTRPNRGGRLHCSNFSLTFFNWLLLDENLIVEFKGHEFKTRSVKNILTCPGQAMNLIVHGEFERVKDDLIYKYQSFNAR